MSAKIPKTLRFGALTFEVITLGDGRLAIYYYEGKTRKVIKRRTLGELRQEAERISTSILNAETAALDVSADDRRIYIAAKETLAPLRLDVDSATRLLVAAAALCPLEHILEACTVFAAQGNLKSLLHTTKSADVVSHFIRHISADTSACYHEPMERDLDRFAKEFPGPLLHTTGAQMEEYLRRMDISSRRRRNLRDKLVTFYNWARDKGYLPESLRTEAEKITRPNVKRKAPALYTPEELMRLIEASSAPAIHHRKKERVDFLPCILIGAFAGLRWAEIRNLEWRDIHWRDEVISVGDENKTGFRLVPILPTLAAWLRPYHGKQGKVCPTDRPDNVIRRLGTAAGLQMSGGRYANALRHSYVSYRVAVTKNLQAVSIETGHSVNELRKSYLRASLDRVAAAWFAILPPTDNVVQMPLSPRG